MSKKENDGMKEVILEALMETAFNQINLASLSAREMIAVKIEQKIKEFLFPDPEILDSVKESCFPIREGENIISEIKADRDRRLKELKEIIAEHNPEALFADGHDHAIMGYSSDGRVIYSVDQIVGCLVERDGMTPDEAIEFFNFNIECAYVGEYTPIYMYEE